MDNNEKKNQDKTVSTKQLKNSRNNGKRNMEILLTVVTVLVLILGLCIGGLLAPKKKETIVIKETEETTEIIQETKTGKKLEDDMDWVYDAGYCIKAENKQIESEYDNKVYNSKDELKVPFININSDYANGINEEIRRLYDRVYNKFGTETTTGNVFGGELKYESYTRRKMLSVVITCSEGVMNSGWSKEYIIYNINLDTLREATYEEVYTECDFVSAEEVKNCAEIALENLNYIEKDAYKETTLKYDKYFININGFNLLITGPMGVPQPLTVKKGATRVAVEDETTKENNNNNNNNNKIETQEKSYFEQNSNLNYTSNMNDDINGKVAIIKMGEKVFQTKMCEEYYEFTDNWKNTYYIKKITNIESEFKKTGVYSWATLYRCVIEYIDKDGVNKSFDTAVIVPRNVEYAYISGPYINYTGTTGYVKNFTDLYDEGEVIDQNSRNDFSCMSKFKNTVYESERKEGEFFYKVEFDENGNPTITAIKMVDRYKSIVYGTFKTFSNIKQDFAAGSVFVTFDYNDSNRNETNTQSGRIQYSNVTDNQEIYLQLTSPSTDGKDIKLDKVR